MKITLEEWAARNYSTPTSTATLARWRREGQIMPPPERKWPHWMVEPDARRVVEGAGYLPLTERIRSAA